MSKTSNNFGTSAFPAASGFGSLAISPISHVGEPLDLSAICDSSILIIFKNLSKKEHENTKVKALEELSNVIEGARERGIDEGVLSAWMQIYPRLSVDLSRRVRQLTHALHGTICSANKKKVAKFMPQIIGPWLCGTYDNDRTVSKAARESLIKTFGLDKLKKVWEVYHPDILAYCTNIIEREQVHTLSGEAHGKNAEEAEAKFARVIGACISALRHIIMDAPLETVSEAAELYRELFGKPTLWEFAYYANSSIRSAVYNLLRACLITHQAFLEPNLDLIVKSVITKSMPVPQTGSVSDYLDTLIQLTEVYPAIWLLVKGKKSNRAIQLLGQLISQGPQGAQPDFWTRLNRLFYLLPEAVIPADRQGIEDFLDAYIHGINGPTVSRTHALLSWTSYFGAVCKILSLKGLSADLKQLILDSRIVPIYEEYLLEGGKFKFRITGAIATAICVNGLLKLSPEKNIALSDSSLKADGLDVIFMTQWSNLEKIVFSRVKGVKNSSEITPEVFSVGVRWLQLLAEFSKLIPEVSSDAKLLSKSYRKVIRVCLENLEEHKDNVPVVATLLERALALSPSLIWRDAQLRLATEDFFNAQLPVLHPSPMAPVVFKAMMHWFRFIDSTDTIEALWTENINALLSSKEDNKAEIIGEIFRDFPAELRGKVPCVPALVEYVREKAQKAVAEDDDEAWAFMVGALKVQGALIPESTADRILELITLRVSDLSPHEVENSGSLLKLEYMARNHLHSLVAFVQDPSKERELLYNLVCLEGLALDLGDNIVNRISQSIEAGIQMPESVHDAHILTLTMAKIITQVVPGQEEPHGRDPIPVDFLASKALHFFGQTPGERKLAIVNALVFPDEEWSIHGSKGKLHIRRLFEKPPRPGVDLVNPLSGCVYLIEDNGGSSSENSDVSGDCAYQVSLRIAIYTFKLIQDPIFYELLDKNTRSQTLIKLLLTAEITKDRLTPTVKMRLDGQSFVSEVQSFMAARLKAHHGFFSETGYTDIDFLGLKLLEISRGRSTMAFYSARILYWLLSELAEIHGCPQKAAEGFIEKLGVRNSEDTFIAIPILLALSQPLTGSKLIDNLRSSLASDVSGISLAQITDNRAPPKLVLLNSLMPKSKDEDISFPTQRAMFLLRNTLTWFDLDGNTDTNNSIVVNEALVSETAKLLKSLVPMVKEVYGSHWQYLYRFVLMGWKCSFKISPMTYWCMKLYDILKTNYKDNDDYEEAFYKYEKELHKVLIQLFESVQTPTEDPAENICYTLLARLVREIPVDEFKSMDAIYPLLRGMPKPIQETAYEIVHQYIQMQQEQISIEAALAREDDEFAPQVTFELLSLVMETPSAEKLEELVFDGMALGELAEESIRGCFLAWRLIFCHFGNATFKVKSAYTANIQDGGYLDKLLDLTFQFLGITRSRFFEPNRNQIKFFHIDEENWSSEKSIKQLLTHLYYLSLLYTPSLVKTWFMAQTNWQIVTGVENYTENYISPLIIDTELTAMSEWAAGELPSATAGSSTDIDIQVRVSRSVREVTITCPIEDQTMELLIRLPPIFPLGKPEIEGVKKVGFTEQQWKALKLASHAVIALQGGSIIDAVMLFRKNVSLHFAGVEECAICYSIVGQERTLPSKKCVTCSNKFHAGCLFKWFKTSNSSTCPLCRSAWQFYGRGNH